MLQPAPLPAAHSACSSPHAHSAAHQKALSHPHRHLLLLLQRCRQHLLRLLLLACWPCLHLQAVCQLRCHALQYCGWLLLQGVLEGLWCYCGGW
jgi:hypothetical protein